MWRRARRGPTERNLLLALGGHRHGAIFQAGFWGYSWRPTSAAGQNAVEADLETWSAPKLQTTRQKNFPRALVGGVAFGSPGLSAILQRPCLKVFAVRKNRAASHHCIRCIEHIKGANGS